MKKRLNWKKRKEIYLTFLLNAIKVDVEIMKPVWKREEEKRKRKWEREREKVWYREAREKERGKVECVWDGEERVSEREKQRSVCRIECWEREVCVCVCVREREREREKRVGARK